MSTMSRRHFLGMVGSGLVAGALGGRWLARRAGAWSRGPENPNFLFVLVDDLGWADLACYGNTLHETPNVDALAAEGMRFTQAYTACAVCSPTRASIQTGKYPVRFGLTDWIRGRNQSSDLLVEHYTERMMPLEEVTMAEAFKSQGYTTAFLGKWHLCDSAVGGHFPENQGYDVNVGGHHMGHPPGGYFSPYNNPKLEDGPEGEYLTDRLGDEAVTLLQQYSQDRDNPFFLMLAFYTVHTPLQPKTELLEYYQAKLATGSGSRWNNARYAAMVHAMDENVGRVLTAVKELGLDKDTVIVFFSDNGGLHSVTSNYPLRRGKGYYYEAGIRVPLIVKWPGATVAASQCDWPVISNDFYPTFLEMAGLPLMPQQHLDGLSLVPLLRGQESLDRDTFYWHYPHYHGAGETPCSAIRCGDYKLIRHYERNTCELYNLRDDIGETTDLRNAERQLADEMEAMLDDWLTQMDAYIPVHKGATRG